MALNTSTLTSTSAGSLRRLPGPDVVRAIALIGVVVMNYHGYLIIKGGERSGGWANDLFDPWTGPLSSRFAATFVLVAGVGVTLKCWQNPMTLPVKTRLKCAALYSCS